MQNGDSESTFRHLQHFTIAKNILWIAILLFAGKVAGAVKEIVIAGKYGTSETVDVYLFGFTLINWIPNILGSLAVALLVPLASKLSQAERKQFNGELTGTLLIVSLTFVVLIAVAGVFVLPIVNLGFTPDGLSQLRKFMVAATPAIIFYFIISHFNTQLLTEERHINTLFNGIPTIILTVFVIFMPPSMGIWTFVIGILIGTWLHLVILRILLNKSIYYSKPLFTIQSEGWRKLNQFIGIMLLGKIILSFSPLIDQLLASNLGPGQIATLGYATRLNELFLGLGATAVARAILPVFSKIDETYQVRKMSIFWGGMLFAAGTIVSLLLWTNSHILVHLVFERGMFTSNDTIEVSKVFRFGTIQIPFFILGIVFAQYFISAQRYKVVVISSVIALSIKLISGWWLADIFGTAGISLSTSLMYLSTCIYFCTIVFLDTIRESA